MTRLLQPPQQLVEQVDLATAHRHAVAVSARAAVHSAKHLRLRALEQERVVAALLQLHDDVQQSHLRPAHALVERVEVATQNHLVVLLLQRRHLDAQNALRLGRQTLLHVLNDSSDEVRAKRFVQLLNRLLVLHVVLHLERAKVVKLVGLNEVQKSPKLLDRVLQRRSRHQQLVVDVQLHEILVEARLGVLQPVRLVDDEICPRYGHEIRAVLHDDFVRRQQHVHHVSVPALRLFLQPALPASIEVPRVKLPAACHAAALRAADVGDRVNVRGPLLELAFPVVNCR
mmetsp:Transcript_5471/g.13814  ORF Transcript_5471/g.13814 Transcript_5471/m.13814 type:complete len:286 (-) Transcript_5471:311-1168(-)